MFDHLAGSRRSQGVGTMAQSMFPTSYVTTGSGVAAPVREASAGDDTACAHCPHAVADHDAISLRFCRATGAATAVETAPRGCICRS
jgi:hypothetical protein